MASSAAAGASVRPRRGGAAGWLAAVLADRRRAVLAAALLLAAVPCLDVLGDPDVWWHLRVGELILDRHAIPTAELFSYTAAGHPWTAHEWLSEVVFASLARAGGLLLVALALAAVAWSGLVALALRARARGAGPYATALALVAGAKAAQPVLGTRPQVFTFALCCWTLLIAERHLERGGRAAWLLPPVALVWANLHAGFVAGLALIAIVVAVEAARRWLLADPAAAPAGRIRALALALAVSALAACVNPAGPAIWGFAVGLSTTVSGQGIVEWASPDFHDAGLLAVLALIATVPALAGLGGRISPRDGVLCAAGICLSLLAVRNIALLVAAALPAWAALASGAGRPLVERRAARRRGAAGALAAVLLLLGAGAGALGVAVARAASAASATGVAAVEPACAATALRAAPAGLRLYAPYAVSDYIVGRLGPSVRVYAYGATDALGAGVMSDAARISGGAVDDPSALALLDGSATQAALVAPGGLRAELLASGGWRAVLRDGPLLLLVRGSPGWAASLPAC